MAFVYSINLKQKKRVYYKNVKASPVGRWTSRSVISIIFPILLLFILPLKLSSLSCRRLKIHENSWKLGETRHVGAALHSNPTSHLTRHVTQALFVVCGERRMFTAASRNNFTAESVRVHPPPPPSPPAPGDITEPASHDRCNMEEREEEQEEQTVLKRETGLRIALLSY